MAVVGAGKMGLPLAAQFASHGWSVIAVDIDEAVVAAINEGRSHVDEEPGLADLVASAHGEGLLRATTDGAAAAREADVVVLIVPVMLDADARPDHRHMDAATDSIAPGIHPGSLVIYETTLPVGDTRGRYAPRLEAASGLRAEVDGDDGFLVAFSPERLYSGAALRNLATYPKLVGGLGPVSRDRAAAFYDGVLDAEIVAMSSAEAAEFSKLADTTYRDVNIALANEFANYADRIGVDVTEVIAAANSQPYSHIHQPGIGVGGHCIPVYPHFLLDRAPELSLVARAREVNDGQVDVALAALTRGARVARRGRRARARPDLSARRATSWPTRGRCRSSSGCARRARGSWPMTRCCRPRRWPPRPGPRPGRGVRWPPGSGRSSPRPAIRAGPSWTPLGSPASSSSSTAATAWGATRGRPAWRVGASAPEAVARTRTDRRPWRVACKVAGGFLPFDVDSIDPAVRRYAIHG